MTATKKPEATLEVQSYWLKPEKEEVYFDVTLSLPRVGIQKLRFIADRYLAYYEDGQRLTDWRTRSSGGAPAGVGEKTLPLARDEARRLYALWLESDEFASLRVKAATEYTAREVSSYSLTRGREAFKQYRDVIATENVVRISQALDHIKIAQGLLQEASAS